MLSFNDLFVLLRKLASLDIDNLNKINKYLDIQGIEEIKNMIFDTKRIVFIQQTGEDSDNNPIYKQLGVIESDKQKYKLFKLIKQKMSERCNSESECYKIIDRFDEKSIRLSITDQDLMQSSEARDSSYILRFLNNSSEDEEVSMSEDEDIIDSEIFNYINMIKCKKVEKEKRKKSSKNSKKFDILKAANQKLNLHN